MAMVQNARKIYWEGEADDTPTHKQKREEENTDSNILPPLRHDMQLVDAIKHAALPRASQRRAIRALHHLELKQANLNLFVVHEIGETSSIAIMELSDGSHSCWNTDRRKYFL